MSEEELRAKCSRWVYDNRGKHATADNMTNSLLMFLSKEFAIAPRAATPLLIPAPAPKPTLLVQDQKTQPAAPIASTRPRMDLSGTKLKWAD